MRFTVEITCDNSAFHDVTGDERDDADATVEEVSRILRALADTVPATSNTDGRLYDANGNRVGEWRFEE